MGKHVKQKIPSGPLDKESQLTLVYRYTPGQLEFGSHLMISHFQQSFSREKLGEFTESLKTRGMSAKFINSFLLMYQTL